MTLQSSPELEKLGKIIGRSLAYLCLQNSDMKEGTLLEKSQFLIGLGLSKSDAAEMLGSTTGSLNVLAHRAKNAKGKGNKSGKEKAKLI